MYRTDFYYCRCSGDLQKLRHSKKTTRQPSSGTKGRNRRRAHSTRDTTTYGSRLTSALQHIEVVVKQNMTLPHPKLFVILGMYCQQSRSSLLVTQSLERRHALQGTQTLCGNAERFQRKLLPVCDGKVSREYLRQITCVKTTATSYERTLSIQRKTDSQHRSKSIYRTEFEIFLRIRTQQNKTKKNGLTEFVLRCWFVMTNPGQKTRDALRGHPRSHGDRSCEHLPASVLSVLMSYADGLKVGVWKWCVPTNQML